MTGLRKFLIVLIAGAVLIPACKPNQRIVESSAEKDKEQAPVERHSTPEVVTAEAVIEAMRTADFNFIYVFRRKDGGVLDVDDRSFMNANTPYEINRKKLADGDRALVVGSNFRFPAENFKLMKERFEFEDRSQTESEIMSANTNSNVR